MNDASSLSRNATSAATSSAVPVRRTAREARARPDVPDAAERLPLGSASRFVGMIPGATAFTRTPRGPPWTAADARQADDRVLARVVGHEIRAAAEWQIDAVVTIAPPPSCTRELPQRPHPRKTPRTFTVEDAVEFVALTSGNGRRLTACRRSGGRDRSAEPVDWWPCRPRPLLGRDVGGDPSARRGSRRRRRPPGRRRRRRPAALGREPARSRLADAAAAARDEGDLAGEPPHRAVPSAALRAPPRGSAASPRADAERAASSITSMISRRRAVAERVLDVLLEARDVHVRGRASNAV